MPQRADQLTIFLLGLILAAAFVLRLANLGHTALQGLDESFHAVVALNMLADPLTPRLYQEPALEVEPGSVLAWQYGTVWLHKPPLAMWQMAGAMAVGGQSTLAMRMPSAVLSTAVAGLAFLLGRLMFGRVAGLIAATILAFTPTLWMLAHGLVFSDHIDTAMIFWLTAAVLLLAMAAGRGSISLAVLAGAAQGLAYLSKSFPAFVVLGIAVVLWMAGRWGFQAAASWRGRHVLALLAGTLLIALPWTIYAWLAFPLPFAQSTQLILAHLGEDVEGWRGPWDRLLFDYAARIGFHFYTPGLIAVVLAAVMAVKRHDAWLLLIVAWWGGFMLPHVLAASKTPSQTSPAVVPLMLAIGWLVGQAWQGRSWAMGAMAGIAVNVLLAVLGVNPPSFPSTGRGYGEGYTFASIAITQRWIGFHLLIGLLGAVVGGTLPRLMRTDTRPLRWGMAGVMTASLGWSLYISIDTCLKVRHGGLNAPAYVELAAVAPYLPADAVILVESTRKLERNMAMFYLRRNAYDAAPGDAAFEDLVRSVQALPATPLLLSRQRYDLDLLADDSGESLFLYALPRL